MNDTPRIPIAPKTTVFILSLSAGLLVLAHTITQAIVFLTGHDRVYGLIHLFDMTKELNIPSFFSGVLLLFSAILFAIIAVAKYREKNLYVRHWVMLALLFLFFAFDEGAMIHELLSNLTVDVVGFETGGLFFFAWVIPGIFFSLLFALMFLRFLLHLPVRAKVLFLTAGFLFIAGAIGFEMLSAPFAQRYGYEGLAYKAVSTVEEILEMAGVIVLNLALLEYIEDNYGEVTLEFRGSRSSTERMLSD